MSDTDLQLAESPTERGLRLSLIGTLDAASAPSLEQRLDELRIAHTPVRLDLAKLNAIDTVGVEALVAAHAAARLNRWDFRIEPDLTPGVASVLRLAHLDRVVSEG